MAVDRREFFRKSAIAAAALAFTGSRSGLAESRMHDLVIKDVKALIDSSFVNCDIGISGGVIQKVDTTCSITPGKEVIEGKGLYASPGWVDLHVHALSPSQGKIGTPLSRLGEQMGLTAVLDAGTVGPGNYDTLKELAISRSNIPVYSMVNIKRKGIRVRDIYRVKPGWEDLDLMERVYADNPDTAKGIKVRASIEDSVKSDPLYYVRKCREAGDAFGKPTMIHIGPTPPDLSGILPLARQGDVITHFMRKQSHCILKNDKVRDEVWDAKARGVEFDIGHGFNSFSYDTAQRALDQGFDDFTISTDQWCMPDRFYVRSFANVMTKFLALGLALEDICHKASTRAARVIGIERGIGEGKPASITLFSLASGQFTLIDTLRKKRTYNARIIPEWTVHNGVKYRAGELDRKLFL